MHHYPAGSCHSWPQNLILSHDLKKLPLIWPCSLFPAFLPPNITGDTQAELIYDSLHPSTSAYMRHLWSRLRPLFMWRTQNGLCGYVSDRSFLALTANIVCSPLISICSLVCTEEVSSIIFSNTVHRTQTLKDTQTSYVVWSEK